MSTPQSKFGRKGVRHRLSPEEEADAVELAEYQGEGMPKTRGECKDVPRPCPYVRCRYHLFLHIKPLHRGESLLLCWPHLEDPTEMAWSCALDEADRHPDGLTLDEISQRMNVTRERVRQIEEALIRRFLHKARKGNKAVLELLDFWAGITNRSTAEEFLP